jgi:uncharacterized protein YgiM (DUF1202 family)
MLIGNINNPQPSTSSNKDFVVKILCKANDPLSVRKGPGINYEKVDSVRYPYKYTIVETQNGWGKLKSGKGWISLSPHYVQRV